MKQCYLFLAVLLFALNASAQSNYSFTNCVIKPGTYTDISSTGTAIAMTNAETGSSVTPIEIGFNFSFNGTTFTQAMIHADGILKFGNVAPGVSTLIAPSPLNSYANVFTNTTAAFQNIVMPLFLDLVQGMAAPQYHVLTTGVAPNRITTIQWKNLRDADNPGSTLQHQFDNVEFQVKLYETTNDIEMAYGAWIASANTAAIRGSAIGIKAGSTSFISYVKTGSLLTFEKGDFTDPAFTAIGRILFVEKSVTPTPGTSMFYYGKIANDITVAKIYVDDAVPQNTSIGKNIQALVKNEGTTAASIIPVTLTVSGANSFTETITVASLPAGGSQVVSFTPFVVANKGLQNVAITANLATDGRAANNGLQSPQTITQSNLNTYNADKKSNSGFGFNSSISQVANKMFGSGTRNISQIRTSFSTYNVLVDIRLYEDNGTGGTPGTLLFTSPVFRTNAQNGTLISVPAGIAVTGDYYVVVSQREAINMGLHYFSVYPKLTFKQYNASLDVNNWAEAATPFNALIAVYEEKALVDVGFEKITAPLCSQTSSEVVKGTVRNFSNQVHDYAANPVTITGSVKNEVTNISTPFSFIKNTGTIAAGGTDTVILLNSYDITARGNHLFTAKTSCATDGEPLNDSLKFAIFTKVFIDGPADSVCPNINTILTNSSTGFLRTPVQWSFADGTPISTSNTITVQPSATTAYYLSAFDSRGCTLTDSIVLKIRSLNVPAAPLITAADTLLSFRNDFKTVLTVPALAGHTISWVSGGVISNGGTTNTVEGFRGINPESHSVRYVRTADGCSSQFGTPVTTRFATGLLISDNAVTTVCDTSFYDNGGAFGQYNNTDYVKTYSAGDPGKKLKLTINKFNIGQFGIMRVYDGDNTSAPEIGRLDRSSPAAGKYEFVASNATGNLTVSMDVSDFASGFLGGFTCQTPMQFRTVSDGIFTNATIWESRPVGSTNFTAATRSPNKGDDTIWVMHNVNYNSSVPLDQVVIETSGNMEVTGTRTDMNMYKTVAANELTIKGTFKTNTGTFFGRNSTNVALFGTLINNIEMQADSVVVLGNATISGTGQIPRLMVNNPQGVTINGNLDISRELGLINGVVKVNAANFIRLESGLAPFITGGNANSYVEGKLRQQIFSTSDSIVFPVGNNGIYRKLILLANQTSFDNSVEYQAELLTGAPPTRTLPGTFTNVNQQWYHNVSITQGSSLFSDATATIYYEPSDGVTNPSALRIGKDDGSTNWTDIGGSGSGPLAGIITSSSFTSFSDFVLANLTAGALPVTLLSFNGNLNGNTAQLNWQVTNEINFARYEVERSTDGALFTGIGTVAASGSAGISSYQFENQLPLNHTIFYYRLKLVDRDGKYRYSNIIVLRKYAGLQPGIVVAPNPFVNRFTIQYQATANQKLQLQLVDISGRILKQQQHQVLTGSNQLYIEAANLPAGSYVLKLMVDGVVVLNKKLIKD